MFQLLGDPKKAKSFARIVFELLKVVGSVFTSLCRSLRTTDFFRQKNLTFPCCANLIAGYCCTNPAVFDLNRSICPLLF